MLYTRLTPTITRHLIHRSPSAANIRLGLLSCLALLKQPLSTAVRKMARPLPKDPLVWIDCEMTGLDLSKDKILEIAVCIHCSTLVREPMLK